MDVKEHVKSKFGFDDVKARVVSGMLNGWVGNWTKQINGDLGLKKLLRLNRKSWMQIAEQMIIASQVLEEDF